MKKTPPKVNMGTGRASWFRGEVVNRRGTIEDLKKKDSEKVYVLHGWTPEAPFIRKQSHIVAIGSCFAWEVSKYLYNNGYRTVLPEDGIEIQRAGSNHTFALRQLFEWAWLGKEPINETWYNEYAEKVNRSDEGRLEVAKYFSDADVFVLTLGLSEIWYDKETSEVFWRAIPAKEYDKDKHAFRISTVEENKENLNTVLNLIKKYAHNAKVIITLSPVPLRATFRPISQMSANTVSKAILRVAIDEVLREHDVHTNDKLYYWPSYEIVKEYLPATKGHPYEGDNIHVTKKTIAYIMNQFAKYYLIK